MKPDSFESLELRANREVEARQKETEDKKRQAERESSKIEVFRHLSDRNRQYGDRAESMIAILGTDSGSVENMDQYARSSRFVLKKAEAESGEVVGYVTRESKQSTDQRSSYYRNINYVFKVCSTDDAGEDTAFMSETTYWTRRGDDQITRLAKRRSNPRSFDPIAAIKRSRLEKRVTQHLDDIHDTVTMFEDAITDPELNPHLAERVKESEFANVGDMIG